MSKIEIVFTLLLIGQVFLYMLILLCLYRIKVMQRGNTKNRNQMLGDINKLYYELGRKGIL